MNTEKLIDDAVTAFTDREIPAPSREHLRIALNAFEASLTRCGCDACTVARRDRTGLTEHDRTAVARVLHEIVYAPGSNYDRTVPGVQEHMLACAEKVAAALPWIVPTPEVEVALVDAVMGAMDQWSVNANLDGDDEPGLWVPRARIKAAIDSVPLPFVAEPQGEPSDAPELPDDCDCEDREALVRPEGLVCGTCGKVIAPRGLR